jgi:hypothetical protein
VLLLLVCCRVRWLAVLHWVFWINTWHDRLYYKLLHGDKDTFALGFALAGHAQEYKQVRLASCLKRVFKVAVASCSFNLWLMVC